MNETENQKRARHQSFLKRELHDLKCGCSHDVWAQKDISIGGEVLATIDPVVRIANDDDSFYVQTFTTRDEVEKFISEIRQAADEAWGEKPLVKTYAGGKPNYCTPEVTPEVTPDVDNAYTKLDTSDRILHKKWVGLTEEEIFQAYKPEMEGMPFNKPTLAVIAGYIEARLEEKNT